MAASVSQVGAEVRLEPGLDQRDPLGELAAIAVPEAAALLKIFHDGGGLTAIKQVPGELHVGADAGQTRAAGSLARRDEGAFRLFDIVAPQREPAADDVALVNRVAGPPEDAVMRGFEGLVGVTGGVDV